MAIREIIQLGNPLLRQVSLPVIEFATVSLRTLVTDMHDTLDHFHQSTGYGRGIAAAQVGELLRIVCIKMDDQRYTLINPEFTYQSDERFLVWDACFSYFGFFFQVSRSRQVAVRYQDLDGNYHELAAIDDFAELLQHELEHLDGELAIDKVVDIKTLCTKQEYEMRHASRE